jgi:UDP-glucuronate decarboxylase
VLALTGSKSRVEHRPLPENDPMQRQPDIARAKALLDWQPRVPLDEGLVETIAYFDRLLRSKSGDGSAGPGGELQPAQDVG